MEKQSLNNLYATTIIGVKKDNAVVIAGDGQVSFGHTILKATANKLRKLNDGRIIAGFAGSTADAFTLFERLEEKLDKHPQQLLRAAVELAKDWRTDKYLRRLEAMMIVADASVMMVISGQGDVIEPEDGVVAIGSGGNYALAAARALVSSTTLPAEEVARKALNIAADICIYTNHNIRVEKIEKW